MDAPPPVGAVSRRGRDGTWRGLFATSDLCDAVELTTDSDRERTHANVRDSAGALWFGDDHSPGGTATLDACRLMDRPFLIVFRGVTRPGEVGDWIVGKGIRTLNVAGDRESNSPGIGDRAEAFLGRVLRMLGHRKIG